MDDKPIDIRNVLARRTIEEVGKEQEEMFKELKYDE